MLEPSLRLQDVGRHVGLKKEDLSGVLDIVTAGDFMDMTEGAQIVFI